MMVVAARLLAIDVVRILLSAIDGSSIILAHLEHLIKQRRSLAKTSVANDSFTVIAKDILINETVGTDRLEAANTLRLTDNQLLAKKKVTFDTISHATWLRGSRAVAAVDCRQSKHSHCN